MAALVHWAESGGDESSAQAVRDAEHAADDRRRELRLALRVAFSTPLDREDLYLISDRLDNVMNGVKDAVRECEVCAVSPDEAVADMARYLAQGVDELDRAVELILTDSDEAVVAADAATKSQRHLERVYRKAMSDTLELDDLREVIGRREIYRRFSRVSDYVTAVSERVWYAVVKES
jgi:hypothetical protein